MAFALKVGQAHAAPFRVSRNVDGVAYRKPSTWTSSNPAMIRLSRITSPDARSVYARCFGPLDPTIASPVDEIGAPEVGRYGVG